MDLIEWWIFWGGFWSKAVTDGCCRSPSGPRCHVCWWSGVISKYLKMDTPIHERKYEVLHHDMEWGSKLKTTLCLFFVQIFRSFFFPGLAMGAMAQIKWVESSNIQQLPEIPSQENDLAPCFLPVTCNNSMFIECTHSKIDTHTSCFP